MSSKGNSTFPKYLTPVKSREQGVRELYKESGEDLEQSSDFMKYIFEAKELPSRKFFWRKNNGSW